MHTIRGFIGWFYWDRFQRFARGQIDENGPPRMACGRGDGLGQAPETCPEDEGAIFRFTQVKLCLEIGRQGPQLLQGLRRAYPMKFVRPVGCAHEKRQAA